MNIKLLVLNLLIFLIKNNEKQTNKIKFKQI